MRRRGHLAEAKIREQNYADLKLTQLNDKRTKTILEGKEKGGGEREKAIFPSFSPDISGKLECKENKIFTSTN